MIDLLNNYLQFLLHPIQNHKNLYDKRSELERMRKGRLFALVDDNYKAESGLDFISLTTVSWIFVLVLAFYTLIFMHLGTTLSQTLLDKGFLPGVVVSSMFQKKLLLITVLGEVAFFPLAAWIYVKFWKVLISFFSNLFAKEVEPEAVDDVVNISLVSNFFLIIPIIGQFFKSISSVFYIFWGLKHNLKFTTTQSVIVIISPLIITSMFMLFMAMYIMLVINLY